MLGTLREPAERAPTGLPDKEKSYLQHTWRAEIQIIMFCFVFSKRHAAYLEIKVEMHFKNPPHTLYWSCLEIKPMCSLLPLVMFPRRL